MKLLNFLKTKWLKLTIGIHLLLFNVLAFADNYVIPVSDVDKTQSGQDFSDTAMAIIKKDILPLLEIGGAILVFFVALAGIARGFKEYQREKDFGPLKSSIGAAILIVIFGGAILYGLDLLRHFNFS